MDTTEQYVKYIFNHAGIGMPYRVDFAPCGKPSGFKPHTQSSQYKSAFVHFHSFYDASQYIISFERLHLGIFQTISFEPFWRILKNRNPVHTTMMNTHQIVANCCALEERVAQLEQHRDYYSNTFDIMAKRITLLEDNLYRLSHLVFDKTAPPQISPQYHDPEPPPQQQDITSAYEVHNPDQEQEIATAYELCSDDDDNHAQTNEYTTQFLHQVSEELDESWLDRAIGIVADRIQAINDKESEELTIKRRIIFTTDICGNA